MAFCYSSFKWTKTPSKHGVFSLWLQTWAHSGDGRALLLLLRSVSLHSLSPAEGEKIPGCDSPLRPTASVQIRKTDVVQRWRRRGAHELVLMYVHTFFLPSSPFSWLLLSGVLRLKPRTFSTVRNGSTPELHPKQSPLFPTFPSITMETTHKSYCFNWSSAWKTKHCHSHADKTSNRRKISRWPAIVTFLTLCRTQATVPVLAQEGVSGKFSSLRDTLKGHGSEP